MDDDAALQQVIYTSQMQAPNWCDPRMSIELLIFFPIYVFTLTELIVQAIALSLAEPSQNPVTAIGAETSTTGAKGRKGTPRKNKNTTPIQDSANIQASTKNRKTKKQVCSFQNGMY